MKEGSVSTEDLGVCRYIIHKEKKKQKHFRTNMQSLIFFPLFLNYVFLTGVIYGLGEASGVTAAENIRQ